jgi:hypothetical protein
MGQFVGLSMCDDWTCMCFKGYRWKSPTVLGWTAKFETSIRTREVLSTFPLNSLERNKVKEMFRFSLAQGSCVGEEKCKVEGSNDGNARQASMFPISFATFQIPQFRDNAERGCVRSVQ